MENYVFQNIFEAVSREIPYASSTVDTPEKIIDFWESLLETNNDKIVSPSVNNPEIIQLAEQYIVEYTMWTLSMSDTSVHTQIRYLYHHLFLCITNTAFSIYKLAFDGLDYQAQVLLRNLYELCMILLNITIDPEKRQALMDSGKNEDGEETWYRYFRPKKLQATLKAYAEKIGASDLTDWHARLYSHLSTYVHNNYISLLTYSVSFDPKNEDILYPNICGAFASRVETTLLGMIEILLYTGLFLKLIGDPEIDISKEHLCDQNSENKEYWNAAAFLNMFNFKCFLQVQENETE